VTDVKRNVNEFNLEAVQANFEQVFSGVLLNGEPANIMRDMGDAVLVSKEIWSEMTETLDLLPIPGMRGSVGSAMREHTADTKTNLDW
tara:strand:+ start:52 stop:315 length:264 start_codon:yes stop_codon:yes gene_type:complete